VESLESREVPAFLAPTTYPTGATAWDVQTADINKDGNLDVLTANRAAGTITVALGNGDGTLAAPRSIGVGATPRALAVADFNGDGKLDVVSANESNTLSLLKGNGDGTFQARSTISLSGGKGTKAVAIEVGDMNHDGKLDLVVGAVSNTYKQRGYTYQDGLIYVLTGNGDGTFRGASKLSIVGDPVRQYFMTDPGAAPVNLALGDVNSDGNLDVVAATYRNIASLEGRGGDRPVYLLPGDGNGGVTQGRAIDLVSGPAALCLDDFNADGRLDLAVSHYDGWGAVVINLGRGDGTFQYVGYCNHGYETFTYGIAAIDVNHDGKLDLVAANRGGGWGITVCLGNGDGTFQDRQNFAYASAYSALAVGDFDGDGYPDLVAIDVAGISMILNDQIW
jgi:hypothetical protein